MKTKLAGYYDYTVVLTYCGMLFAFYGILQALRKPLVFPNRFQSLHLKSVGASLNQRMRLNKNPSVLVEDLERMQASLSVRYSPTDWETFIIAQYLNGNILFLRQSENVRSEHDLL